MKKLSWWGFASAALLCAGTAFAIDSNTTLYIRARNTRLLASSATTAKTVKLLQPGDTVVYEKADSRSHWHHIHLAMDSTVKGVVYQSCLSVTKPDLDVSHASVHSGNIDSSMAESGAATKGMDELSQHYGADKNWTNEVKELSALELLALGVTDADVATLAKKSGLGGAQGRNP